jgi:hypothetical protein
LQFKTETVSGSSDYKNEIPEKQEEDIWNI